MGRARSPEPAHAASLLAAVADDVADVLSRIGVERFTAEPGEPYDAARHRPVAVAPVTEPGRAGTVVSVQADGFEQGGRVLRKAEVCVGKLPPDAEPPGEPDTPAPSSRLRDTVRSETMNTGP
ncbi:nucleotide exchange factor GrpE [Actinomadura yumaensis]|uniref:nucleotide exchange factor GrpE n=1 Tax=Actinomadura TaxID=1988 RepID=UPI002814EA0C|nr:nucleotide exchange factor GrpE [Actinomadura sp. J1-007]